MVNQQVAVRRNGMLPAMSRNQAAYLLKTIWPKAPEAEIVKAALLCHQYGLNPLMRQVFLIPFKNKRTGETEWATVLGIRATRQMAKKNGRTYGYADGPRIMTEAEQMAIYGQVDASKIYAITRIRDQYGNIFPGYGSWPKDASAYGEEKGNSPLNMAFIRSERNALDKMAPGELPEDLEVVDESYQDMPAQVMLAQGKKEFDQQVEKDIEDIYPKGNGNHDAPPTAEELKAGIETVSSDMQYLIDGLNLLKWRENTLKTWLKQRDEFKGLNVDGSVKDILSRMNAEQLKSLRVEIDRMVG